MRSSTSGALELYNIANNTITSAGPMDRSACEWTAAAPLGDFSGIPVKATF